MTEPIARLREIMARLRNPDGGCPWDLEQTFATIAPYTIEEAYEVADAVERGDLGDIRDELGDLLLQVVFQAQIAQEAGHFDFDDVASAICDKLVRRHPHIFGDETARSPEDVKAMWDAIKAQERAGKPDGILDSVPVNLPPLMRAHKMQKAMAKVGFDWTDPAQVVDKVAEELEEFCAAARDGEPSEMEAEFGDLLFTLVNFARHTGIDADAALRGSNARFASRVRHMDAAVRAEGGTLPGRDLDELERRWAAAKAAERTGSRS